VAAAFTSPDYPAASPPTWVVERIDVDGEELPMVRHAVTWLPAPVALRYALRTRFSVGSAQLTADIRAIAILYNWSECPAGVGGFEAFLTSGNFLSREQLKSLAAELRWRRKAVTGPAAVGQDAFIPVANQTYNVRLFAVQHFLKWAYDPTNHGGRAGVDLDELRNRTRDMYDDLEEEKLGVAESHRHEPLSPEEVRIIRSAIGPNKFGEFPPGGFSKETRYRNWIMFEMGLNLGPRKSELLTLKVEHLSRGKVAEQILVPRQQDAPEDPRTRRRPRGKTLERLVPLMDHSILPKILEYRDAEPPVGRGGHASPYLLLTADGHPVSNSTADYVIKQVGRYALRALDEDETLDVVARERCRKSLQKLSWHRLRHTWAEAMALSLYREHGEGAWAILRNWGGWRREASMERYIEYARHRLSGEAGVRHINTRYSRVKTSGGTEYAGHVAE
jgi:hypothetical protein